MMQNGRISARCPYLAVQAPWCVCWGAWGPLPRSGELWSWRRAAALDATVMRTATLPDVVVDLLLLLWCVMGSTIWVGRNPSFDEADKGGARGRHSLREGVVLDPIRLPSSSSRETLGSFESDDGGTNASLPS
ncbi:hypothetical protein ZWY2020_044737 [Hordeum vulgare]|nr:hypothetical protein ZWY2020_044737 [Hordeum vulgare]